MSAANFKPLLLALDGSEHAFQTVAYVSQIPSLLRMRIILLNVFSKIPEVYWDLERQPNLTRRLAETHAWELSQEKHLRSHLEKARKRLVKAGFAPEKISAVIQPRKTGIARDILDEAGKGCHAVVVGRKGLAHLRQIVLGSVSSKLLEKLAATPLMLIGKGARPGKVMIAVDGSDGSMRAVEFAGRTLDGSPMEVTITHVVRSSDRGLINQAEAYMDRFFSEARQRLMAEGVKPTQISTQIITHVTSRAGALIDEARRGGYGTIVTGRRGLSKVQEFFIGRVTNKLVHMGKGLAVWVVN